MWKDTRFTVDIWRKDMHLRHNIRRIEQLEGLTRLHWFYRSWSGSVMPQAQKLGERMISTVVALSWCCRLVQKGLKLLTTMRSSSWQQLRARKRENALRVFKSLSCQHLLWNSHQRRNIRQVLPHNNDDASESRGPQNKDAKKERDNRNFCKSCPRWMKSSFSKLTAWMLAGWFKAPLTEDLVLSCASVLVPSEQQLWLPCSFSWPCEGAGAEGSSGTQTRDLKSTSGSASGASVSNRILSKGTCGHRHCISLPTPREPIPSPPTALQRFELRQRIFSQ